MKLQELKEELLSNKVRPIYVFTGNELALQDVYIGKIKEISGLESVRVDYLKLVFNKLQTKTLIKTKPMIYIIRNDEDYLKHESSWDKVLESKLKGNILILLYSEVEKNTKFLKAHDSVLTQFDYIDANILSNRLQAITNMPKQYCDELVRLCGCNYGRIQHELYKLQMLSYIDNMNLNNVFLRALKNNVIHENIGDIIFNFTNSILERNVKLAYELLPKIKQTEDGNAVKLLTVLYNSFRQLLMVQSSPNEIRTEEKLGMTKGQIYAALKNCNRYNVFELVNIVKTIRYLEKGIKIGEVSEEFAMEYLMGCIW